MNTAIILQKPFNLSIQKFWLKVLFGFSLLFLFSQITIPLKPVPITLQTIAVLFIGLTFDPKAAFTAVLSFILAGIIGIPVFAKFNCGINYFLGATGGYLIGFLLAATSMSFAIKNLQKLTIKNALAVSALGQIIIYACGLLWLWKCLGIEGEKAFILGLYPFIVSGILKAIGLVALVKITSPRRFG